MSGTCSLQLGNSYRERAYRLLPVSTFGSVITMIASVLPLPTLRAPTVLYDSIAGALHVANCWFITHTPTWCACPQLTWRRAFSNPPLATAPECKNAASQLTNWFFSR